MVLFLKTSGSASKGKRKRRRWKGKIKQPPLLPTMPRFPLVRVHGPLGCAQSKHVLKQSFLPCKVSRQAREERLRESSSEQTSREMGFSLGTQLVESDQRDSKEGLA